MSEEIPALIADVLSDEEIENIRDRRGWAIGHVAVTEPDSDGVTHYTEAYIELFNGDGTAGEFGGVRFMAVDDGEYVESYAYATPAAVPDEKRNFAVVMEYTDPSDPDYGQPAP